MDWENLFATHILERGHQYYCDGSVFNMNKSDDIIRAGVAGSEDYEVEISLCDGDVTDMYCSCPYAAGGSSCKHMAAVLYKWSENDAGENAADGAAGHADLFAASYTKNARKKKVAAVEALVANAETEAVRSALVSALMENEKLLLRFYNMVNKQITKEDITNYIRQIDMIVNRSLGRDHFISYREAGAFISELEDFIDQDVHSLLDYGNYSSAFEVMNYIFVMLGEVDIDDSDGETGLIADQIYQLWLEMLDQVTAEEKGKMFDWFTSHLDGSVIDYLEEYIEQIIMEGFQETEYEQKKIDFIVGMIEQSEKEDSGWNRDYAVGKWAVKYLQLLEEKNIPEQQIEETCKRYWGNSSVREYYMDFYMKKKEYERVLQVLNESILLDKQYSGLISEYQKRKKKIYLLQGDKDAYVKQLWRLVLKDEAGNLELYRELKEQYSVEEWLVKREEVFKKISSNVNIESLYREEKLYDRLLPIVLKTPGLYVLQEYGDVLGKVYPEQILDKYQYEINRLAVPVSSRSNYAYLVSILRRMEKLKGGKKVVEKIAGEWRIKYKNRPAMMDELGKL